MHSRSRATAPPDIFPKLNHSNVNNDKNNNFKIQNSNNYTKSLTPKRKTTSVRQKFFEKSVKLKNNIKTNLKRNNSFNLLSSSSTQSSNEPWLQSHVVNDRSIIKQNIDMETWTINSTADDDGKFQPICKYF